MEEKYYLFIEARKIYTGTQFLDYKKKHPKAVYVEYNTNAEAQIGLKQLRVAGRAKKKASPILSKKEQKRLAIARAVENKARKKRKRQLKREERIANSVHAGYDCSSYTGKLNTTRRTSGYHNGKRV